MATETTIYRIGISLAVRLLADCKLLCGTKVRQRREGKRIILELADPWPHGFLVLAWTYTDVIPKPTWDPSRRPRSRDLSLDAPTSEASAR